MAFTKISGAQTTVEPLNDTGVMGLPNQPTISAAALKAAFDSPAKQCVAPAVNRLIDELGETTAAANIGATSPSGRTVPSPTVQTVMNKLSDDLATAEAGISTAVAQAHTHANKALLDTYAQSEADLADAVSKKHDHSNKSLLDTYSQTEANLADAVSKKHDHSNKSLLDSYTQTESDLADAVSKKHAHSNKSLLDTYTQTESDIADAVSKKHSHSNKTVIDKFGEDSGGNPTYDGNPIGGGGQADAYKTIEAAGSSFVASGADTFKINAGSNVTITALSGDKGIQISATGGGQSTGDMLMSDYDPNGTVKSSTNGITGYVASAISGKADSSSLATVATSGAYSDLSGTPSLATVATSGAYSDLSGTPTLATVATSGAYSDLSGTPTIPTTLAGLTGDVNIASPSNDQVLKYDGTSSKWVNGSAPAGGHTMLPTPAAGVNEASVVSAINAGIAEGGTNDDVASLFGIGKWSNAYEKLAIVKATSAHPIGTSGIGTWQDNIDPSNPPSKADEQGWGWIEWSALHGIGSENVDVKLSFDPDKCSTPIILGGYIIDDVNDMMCIKFGNQISSADTETAWVGIKIIVTRTAATEITP